MSGATKAATMRQASVYVRWKATGSDRVAVDIPDDVHPDKVDDWIGDWLDTHAGDQIDTSWPDDVECDVDEWKVTGEWGPPEGTPEHAAWLLRPTPGQRDIFGGEVAS